MLLPKTKLACFIGLSLVFFYSIDWSKLLDKKSHVDSTGTSHDWFGTY